VIREIAAKLRLDGFVGLQDDQTDWRGLRIVGIDLIGKAHRSNLRYRRGCGGGEPFGSGLAHKNILFMDENTRAQ
jgi:hypothetical protein